MWVPVLVRLHSVSAQAHEVVKIGPKNKCLHGNTILPCRHSFEAIFLYVMAITSSVTSAIVKHCSDTVSVRP